MSALAEVIDQDVQTLMDSVGGNSAQLPVGELRLLNHVHNYFLLFLIRPYLRSKKKASR